MLPGMEMLACPNLAVSPEVMQHIVHVESSANPFAIGVVGGQLERQPTNVAEALATVEMLDAKGYNFSVGLAQVNRANLGRYGLDSYQKAFNACANLSAGAHILADCHASAHGDWGKAFSCYYSGNFTTGFRDGYVQKVYASINQDANRSSGLVPVPTPAAQPIALRLQPVSAGATAAPTRTTELKPVTIYAAGNPNYRVALRSMVIDAAAAATVPAIVAAISQAATDRADPATGAPSISPPDVNNNQVIAGVPGRAGAPSARLDVSQPGDAQSASSDNAPSSSVFVPTVRGPNDVAEASASAGSVPAMSQTSTSATGADRADLRQENGDAAFVF